LGLTGASAHQRAGFKDLLAAVSLGQVGLILSSEVTRLARNCSDWYPLLDLCGYKRCLIADREGVYDPASVNGRLLLGLKRPGSQSTSASTFARLKLGQTHVLLEPSFGPRPEPAPAMASTEIADMLARIGQSERRPPIQSVQLLHDLRVGVRRR
jgi:hypothetical protein